MARVRKEADEAALQEAYAAAAAAVAAEKAAGRAAASGGDAAPASRCPTSAPVDVKALWERIKRPENRRTVAIWAGAAAMLLVFVGVVAISGVNAILGGSGTPDRQQRVEGDQRRVRQQRRRRSRRLRSARPDASRDASSANLGRLGSARAHRELRRRGRIGLPARRVPAPTRART